MREPLPHWVTEAMQRLEQNSEEAWLVGGCVRDRLLGRPVHDYDLTVSCLPDRTAWLFRDHRLVEDGRKHGTIGVVTEGGVLEMTTFRTDGEYRDHRHPESVQFVPDLREDLARRDFTVNAMALSCRGELRDPFGGQADLAARLLRCVGDPCRRFREDALRILRCARFASELGFRVEEATLRAGEELAGEAAVVSRERITAEWENISPDATLPGRWNCCPCGRVSSPAWGGFRQNGKRPFAGHLPRRAGPCCWQAASGRRGMGQPPEGRRTGPEPSGNCAPRCGCPETGSASSGRRRAVWPCPRRSRSGRCGGGRRMMPSQLTGPRWKPLRQRTRPESRSWTGFPGWRAAVTAAACGSWRCPGGS